MPDLAGARRRGTVFAGGFRAVLQEKEPPAVRSGACRLRSRPGSAPQPGRGLAGGLLGGLPVGRRLALPRLALGAAPWRRVPGACAGGLRELEQAVPWAAPPWRALRRGAACAARGRPATAMSASARARRRWRGVEGKGITRCDGSDRRAVHRRCASPPSGEPLSGRTAGCGPRVRDPRRTRRRAAETRRYEQLFRPKRGSSFCAPSRTGGVRPCP